MEITGLSKEKKETIVRYLMKCYRDAKFNIEFLEDCDLINERMNDYRIEKMTCLMIDKTLVEMDQELRQVIELEFMDRRDINEILDMHSRSNYYRLRSKAVDEFLRCLKP